MQETTEIPTTDKNAESTANVFVHISIFSLKYYNTKILERHFN